MNYYIITDGHWTWLVRASRVADAKQALWKARPDAGQDLKVRSLPDEFDKYDGVIGLEGLEPPYEDGMPPGERKASKER